VVQHEFAMVLGERTRLSREIHDTLLQSLAALGPELEALATRVASLAGRPSALDDAERAAFWAARWSGADPDAVGIDADGALLVRTAAGSLDRRIAPS